MATISKRASVLAVMEEVTENTPVVPAGATDFMALQDDYDFAPAFDELVNAELTGTIAPAKSVLGAENPTLSFSHYIRNSGTEAVAPNYGKLMEGLLGAKLAAPAEHDTVSSSTTSLIKVNTGEGASHPRGTALLGKDATNGYWIRNVYSRSGDDLTLAHNVPVAPAAGVNLGRCTTYLPANEHKSYTLWGYEGNGGLVQMIAGTKVTSMSMTVDPEQMINAQFNFEGTTYYRNPMRVVTADAKLDFDIGGSALVATIPVGFYKTPHDLASAITIGLVAAGGGDTSCTYSDSSGKFSIISEEAELNLLWSTGANTANTIGDLIGFVVASDDTGSLTYAADNAISFAAPFTPSYDAANPLVGKDAEV